MGLRLNLGCGRSPLAGWVNVDHMSLPGVDVVADLDHCRTQPLPFEENSVEQLRMIHVLEHIGDTLALMQELHRIAEPGATLIVNCPYGSSDDAYEDPTHRQRLFVGSFGYFGQPHYWRADYGYRGDWIVEEVTLRVRRDGNEGLAAEAIGQRIQLHRNIVAEMGVLMRAVKPIRAAERELQANPPIRIELV